MHKVLTTEHVIHVMDKNNSPALHVSNGERIVIETAKPGIPDEVFTKDYSREPFPKRILTITGPIYVDGAEPGDMLKLHIESIDLDDMGKMWMGQWMGALMDEVDHCYMRRVAVKDGKVCFDEKTSFPIRPMIGTIGVAPEGEGINCVLPGDYGGNMDALTAAPGNIVYLPVFVPGALLAVGDVHAAMGYGEILGTGVEIGSKVTLTVELVKECCLKHPMIESDSHMEVIVSGTDMLELCREATRAAIAYVQQQNGCSFDEAYALVGQTSDLRILQIVNYCTTISMAIPKSILEKQK